MIHSRLSSQWLVVLAKNCHKIGWIRSTKTLWERDNHGSIWPLMKSNGLAFSRPGAAQVRATWSFRIMQAGIMNTSIRDPDQIDWCISISPTKGEFKNMILFGTGGRNKVSHELRISRTWRTRWTLQQGTSRIQNLYWRCAPGHFEGSMRVLQSGSLIPTPSAASASSTSTISTTSTPPCTSCFFLLAALRFGCIINQ